MFEWEGASVLSSQLCLQMRPSCCRCALGILISLPHCSLTYFLPGTLPGSTLEFLVSSLL